MESRQQKGEYEEGKDLKKRRMAALIAGAAAVELFFLVCLSFFIKTNLLVAVSIVLSFQIPLAVRIFAQKKQIRKICKVCSVLLLTSGVIALLACHGRNYYIESMTVVDNTSVDIERYRPFDEASWVARLEEEPELTLSEDLPVLNGSAVLFPLYSSIVNMVYPNTIPKLNEKGSPFRYTDTEAAYKELFSGKTDVVFSEEPSEEILELAKKKGLEIELLPIGAEGFVFFTNRGNPVENLTQDELRTIYSGRARNWQSFGGEDVEIRAFQHDDSNSSQKRLKKFMGRVPLMESQQQFQLDSDSGITETVSTYTNHMGAIGFSFSYYTRSMDVDKGLKLLSVDGIAPDNGSISSGRYPLSDRIYCAVIKGRVSENTGKLLDWIASAQGQRLVETAGYAPDSR